MTLNEARTQAVSVDTLALGDAQCRIDVITGPDGGLYFSAVNESGGAIYRLTPATQ